MAPETAGSTGILNFWADLRQWLVEGLGPGLWASAYPKIWKSAGADRHVL
jgi:hypothetical protein